MKAPQLKSNQADLKEKYMADPDSAVQNLSATGTVDFENLAFQIRTPNGLNPSGLHPASGGDGSFQCPVEIMLSAWAACAGVTLAAVAHSMRLQINSCDITAIGEMNFRGTLAVDKESPIGLTSMRLEFSIVSDEVDDKIQKLIQLTERYCVVHQTLCRPPKLELYPVSRTEG